MNSRLDGGPTSWEGYIVTADPDKSYREFAIEFQDTQLAYANTSTIKVTTASSSRRAIRPPARRPSTWRHQPAQDPG